VKEERNLSREFASHRIKVFKRGEAPLSIIFPPSPLKERGIQGVR